MPISEIEMFELMEKALAPATTRCSSKTDEWRSDRSTSYFNNPVNGAEIHALDDLLASQPNLLLALIRRAEEKGAIATAHAIREVAYFLAERAEELETPEKPATRLSEFVYPVI